MALHQLTLFVAIAFVACAFAFVGNSPSVFKNQVSLVNAKSSFQQKNTIHYVFGGDPENKPKILRENENEAFVSDFEKKETAEKLKDPVLLVALFSVLFPFFLLAFCYATGLIQV
mmetsp:Transcript_1609/g.2104  ORF Transcript_1609/g.2104 Transcript_1609/m.2104 type:complete len:115 (-) Transcript_1609:407-751(-)